MADDPGRLFKDFINTDIEEIAPSGREHIGTIKSKFINEGDGGTVLRDSFKEVAEQITQTAASRVVGLSEDEQKRIRRASSFKRSSGLL